MIPNLRWDGDFSLARLRAQLARKYEFHPDVEPEYGDNYKISLGKMLLERKPGGFGPGGKGTNQPVRLWRGPATADEALTGQDWSKGGSLAMSKPGSAASSTASLSTAASTTALSSFYSSKGMFGTGGLKPPSRERDPAEAASLQLWRESNGCLHYINDYIQELAEAAGDGGGKDKKKGGKKGGNPLAKATVPGMQKALKAGANLEWQNPDCNGMTLLLRTAKQGVVNLFKYLLAIGADITAVDWGKRSVLHWASNEGHPKVVEYVLQQLMELQMGTAMVHARDVHGDTPLHLACLGGHLPVVKLLCSEKKASASPHVLNYREETPLVLAQKARMHHVVRYLTLGKPVAENVKVRDMDRDCNDSIARIVRLTPNPNAKKAAAKKAPAKKK